MCFAPRYISGAIAAPCSDCRNRASPRATPWAASASGHSRTAPTMRAQTMPGRTVIPASLCHHCRQDTRAVIKRSLIVVHRWLGVAFCLFFVIWFTSGIGMMYWDFPEVTPADRLERAPALDPATLRVSPAQAVDALKQSHPPGQIRLNTYDGRPVYRFRVGRAEQIVYADPGTARGEVSRDVMARVAAAWTGQPGAAATVEPIDVDQWTVQGSFRSLKPLWKYSWPGGEQVYVSQVSGEVVQYTTPASRLGAYLGPIPHWLYFTPLRKPQLASSRVVIGSSGIGTAAAIVGLAIGVWMYSPAKRYRSQAGTTSIPYRGQKRWHMVLGLIFGIGAATWAFSGMLSMDPFPVTRRGERGDIPAALRGGVPVAALSTNPQSVLVRLPNQRVKELELTSFDGEPVYVATIGGADTRIVTASGEVRTTFDRDRIRKIVTASAGPSGLAELRDIAAYDWYYLDRRGARPLPVILARLNDADQSRYYIDPRTARVVATYGWGNWLTGCLSPEFHHPKAPCPSHTLPPRTIGVMPFRVDGPLPGVTSLILAWRVIGRTLLRTGVAEKVS